MGSISRHSIIKKRKNFLPTILIIGFLWGAITAIVYFIEPSIVGIIPLFFILFFLALLFTFSLVFGDKRRSLITTVSLILFLILRYFGIGNILNFLLIGGLALTAEIYLAKK